MALASDDPENVPYSLPQVSLEGPHILDSVQRAIVRKTPFALLCTSILLVRVVSLHAQSCEGSDLEASDFACGEFLWDAI